MPVRCWGLHATAVASSSWIAQVNETLESSEPRWPAAVALCAISLLNMALPEQFSFGPFWLLTAVVGVLLVPTVITHRLRQHSLNQKLAYFALSIVTMAMIFSLTLLVRAMANHSEKPPELLRGASALWLSNIFVFASWYWRLDAGGPNQRDRRKRHDEGAFLFPQMQTGKNQVWRPGFVDYLFLAFNTSTAFSPTDVPVLSPWAKLLMMVQSLISLLTVALLAARAVNIL